MTDQQATLGATAAPAIAPGSAAAPWAPDPYLHVGDDRIYNPLTNRTIREGEAGYAELHGLVAGTLSLAAVAEEVVVRLREGEWLVGPDAELDSRFFLKVVSLEAHTVCNQSCYFCPVSLKPRRSYFMPTELYEDILRQLSAWRTTIEAVCMINYNEPTADRRFLDQVRAIKAAGLPPAVLTNGSGLTPQRVDALVEMGGLCYFSVNLSTLDRERYARERGTDQLALVLRNLDYLKDKPLSETMEIMVLGTGDERHAEDFNAIRERFAGGLLEVKRQQVMDRAGHLPVGLRPAGGGRLCGCENLGSRPLQHLHITPQAKCVLCCEDYDENYVVGDLTTTSLDEILTGPAYRRMRRWIYGREAAPENFICNKCVFALRR
ncbi:MAG: radical SAM protein [bacterium]|nr:radical SAM protein [bacterium]